MASWERTDEELHYVDKMLHKELEANQKFIPKEHIEKGIKHYLDHDEYETAFEYLYLEIMEREQHGTKCTIGKDKAMEIALLLELDKEEWLGDDFWIKFSKWCPIQASKVDDNI